MKIAVVTILSGLMVAGSAVAEQRATDLDYIRATRCKGLAVGSGLSDTAGLDAYLKAAGRGRTPIAEDRAQSEFDQARRQARNLESRPRYAAELAGACAVYMGAGQATAQVGAAKDTATR